MTTNTLIALVDGSAYSESVCHHAAWIAAHNDWAVKIYHVLSRRDGLENQDLSGAIRLGARTRLLEQLSSLDEERAKLAKERGRAILEDAKAIVQGAGDIDVETRLRHSTADRPAARVVASPLLLFCLRHFLLQPMHIQSSPKKSKMKWVWQLRSNLRKPFFLQL